jgi:hypothetical protein
MLRDYWVMKGEDDFAFVVRPKPDPGAGALSLTMISLEAFSFLLMTVSSFVEKYHLTKFEDRIERLQRRMKGVSASQFEARRRRDARMAAEDGERGPSGRVVRPISHRHGGPIPAKSTHA